VSERRVHTCLSTQGLHCPGQKCLARGQSTLRQLPVLQIHGPGSTNSANKRYRSILYIWCPEPIGLNGAMQNGLLQHEGRDDVETVGRRRSSKTEQAKRSVGSSIIRTDCQSQNRNFPVLHMYTNFSRIMLTPTTVPFLEPI
jgi:hypothetical protein